MSEATYLSPLIHDPSAQKFVMGILVASGLALVGYYAGTKAKKTLESGKGLIPSNKFTLVNFFDFFIEGFLKYSDSVMGRENRIHAPFCACLFLFIFISNLLGLVPGMPAITTTVWVNVGLALVVFVHFNVAGAKQHGIAGYLKHFAGPIWWLSFFIFPVEILSTCIRLLTLNLRLYWNISADHIVLSIFTDLVPYFVPIAFYLLGTFVSFMQAFIFTTLTMIYILLATQHEEEEHQH